VSDHARVARSHVRDAHRSRRGRITVRMRRSASASPSGGAPPRNDLLLRSRNDQRTHRASQAGSRMNRPGIFARRLSRRRLAGVGGVVVAIATHRRQAVRNDDPASGDVSRFSIFVRTPRCVGWLVRQLLKIACPCVLGAYRRQDNRLCTVLNVRQRPPGPTAVRDPLPAGPPVSRRRRGPQVSPFNPDHDPAESTAQSQRASVRARGSSAPARAGVGRIGPARTRLPQL